MKSILEELYYGNITPGEKRFVRDSNFGRAMEALTESEERLLELLNERGKEIFLAISNAQIEINSITAVEYFADGFRLGAKIMLEVMSDTAGGCAIYN